jgi:hypothetical protein
MSKKATLVATLFLAMFVGFSAPFCGQLNIQQQAVLYGKTPVQITYFVRISSTVFYGWLLTSVGGLELGGICWTGNWWLSMVATLQQVRAVLSHLLDARRPARCTDMGSIDDKA